MIIKKRTTALAVGAALSLTLAAAAHAQDNTAEEVSSDPTVIEDAMAPGADEAQAVGEDAEAMASDAAESAEEAAMAAEEEAEGAAATAMDVANDDGPAEELQGMITADPDLASYGLDVIEVDGRYSVNGMIDDNEDYTKLQQMLGEVDGIDPSMIDNNVVQN